MAKPRPSGLEVAAAAVVALLAALGDAVRGILDRKSSDSESLNDDRTRSRSTGRAIPMPNESPERCPPDRGRLVTVRWHMSDVSRDYQARITGFEPYTEWKFETIEFDGFRSTECRLQEAKAKYDQFFDPETGQPDDFFADIAVEDVLKQARKQSRVVRDNPPAKLTWYFMQPISHKFFSGKFSDESLPIESLLYP